MKSQIPPYRIIGDIPEELEWAFLVNETLIGEKCIVPLLQGIASDNRVTGQLQVAIKRQIDEEADHVRRYRNLLGGEPMLGSEYDKSLSSVVKGMDKITLRLFALQGLLEGIALGALDHRITNWEGSHSYATDLKAQSEEVEHVALSYPHFRQLITIDGVIPEHEFREVTKRVKAIFQEAFSGSAISRAARLDFGVDANAESIEASQAIKDYRRKTARTLAENKRKFERTYQQAVEAHA